MTTLPVLAVTGLSKERRLASGDGVEAVGAGGSPQRLRLLLDGRRMPACRAVVSFGIAGGLDPSLTPGDVVIGTGIVADAERFPVASALTEALHQRLAAVRLTVVRAELAGVDAAVMTVDDKAALRRRSGAAAADMESHVAAAFAAAHGLPFAAIRVVCDPAERALPAFAAQALTPEGDPDIRAVLGALLRGHARVSDLSRLARDSSAAFSALKRCRSALGYGLGIPDR